MRCKIDAHTASACPAHCHGACSTCLPGPTACRSMHHHSSSPPTMPPNPAAHLLSVNPTRLPAGGCARPSGGRGRRRLQAGPALRRAPAPKTARCERSPPARPPAGLQGKRVNGNWLISARVAATMCDQNGHKIELQRRQLLSTAAHPSARHRAAMLAQRSAPSSLAQRSPHKVKADTYAAQRTRERELSWGAAAARPHTDALDVLHFAAHRRPHQAGGGAGGGDPLCNEGRVD